MGAQHGGEPPAPCPQGYFGRGRGCSEPAQQAIIISFPPALGDRADQGLNPTLFNLKASQ